MAALLLFSANMRCRSSAVRCGMVYLMVITLAVAMAMSVSVRSYRDGVKQVRHPTDATNTSPLASSVSRANLCPILCATVFHDAPAQPTDNGEHQLTISPSDPDKAALSQLVDWFAPSASLRSVYIQHDDTGDHCLHALHTIPANQVLLSIPLSHMLTAYKARESDIGRQLAQLPSIFSRHTYLAAYMITEMAKGRQSAWWPYLQSLPTSTKHLASAWSDRQLQWLQGTSALVTARDQQQDMRETYKQLRTLPSFTATYGSFAHALRLVHSRCFGYDTAHCHRSTALVPLLDIVNHATTDAYNSLWHYDSTLHAFTLRTSVALPAHQPLLISYGDNCNGELLTGYGFVLQDNGELDDVEVAYAGLGAGGVLVKKTVRLRAAYDGSGSQRLVEDVRRVAMRDAAALQDARLRQTRRQPCGTQSGRRVMVERRLLQRIAEVVKHADSRYGGDRAAEAARLSGWSGAKGKQWQALVVRVGERRVLQWWLDVCALGERWLADGADVGQLWHSERGEVRRLQVETLVKDVWLKALKDEEDELCG